MTWCQKYLAKTDIRQSFICIFFIAAVLSCTFFEFFECSNIFNGCTLKKRKVHTTASGKSSFCHLSFFCSLTIPISSHLIQLVYKLQLLYMKNPHRIGDNVLVAVPRRSFVLNFKIGSLCCHPVTEHSLPWAASLLPYCLFHAHNPELLQTLFALKKHSWLAARPRLSIDTVRSFCLS